MQAIFLFFSPSPSPSSFHCVIVVSFLSSPNKINTWIAGHTSRCVSKLVCWTKYAYFDRINVDFHFNASSFILFIWQRFCDCCAFFGGHLQGGLGILLCSLYFIHTTRLFISSLFSSSSFASFSFSSLFYLWFVWVSTFIVGENAKTCSCFLSSKFSAWLLISAKAYIYYIDYAAFSRLRFFCHGLHFIIGAVNLTWTRIYSEFQAIYQAERNASWRTNNFTSAYSFLFI